MFLMDNSIIGESDTKEYKLTNDINFDTSLDDVISNRGKHEEPIDNCFIICMIYVIIH